MVGILVCSCGLSREVDVWMPTSGVVGDKREAGVSCPGCDEEAVGQVEIVEVR